jgi:ankyrin repeat protein
MHYIEDEDESCKVKPQILRLYYLEKGVDVEAAQKGYDMESPLLQAAHSGHEAVVRLLLEHGANTEVKDDSNQTPLILAANQKRQVIVQLPLDGGADVEAADRNGRTPLW